MPTHVLSSIAEARAAGRSHDLLTMAVAGWLHVLREDALSLEDSLADDLRPLARAGGTDPRPLLAARSVFGSLGEDPGLAAELEAALVALDRHGAREAVATSHTLLA